MVPASAKAIGTSLSFVHRANIERYRKLLQTVLTEHERAFIQRRLDEEQDALASLQKPAYAISNCG